MSTQNPPSKLCFYPLISNEIVVPLGNFSYMFAFLDKTYFKFKF